MWPLTFFIKKYRTCRHAFHRLSVAEVRFVDDAAGEIALLSERFLARMSAVAEHLDRIFYEYTDVPPAARRRYSERYTESLRLVSEYNAVRKDIFETVILHLENHEHRKIYAAMISATDTLNAVLIVLLAPETDSDQR